MYQLLWPGKIFFLGLEGDVHFCTRIPPQAVAMKMIFLRFRGGGALLHKLTPASCALLHKLMYNMCTYCIQSVYHMCTTCVLPLYSHCISIVLPVYYCAVNNTFTNIKCMSFLLLVCVWCGGHLAPESPQLNTRRHNAERARTYEPTGVGPT